MAFQVIESIVQLEKGTSDVWNDVAVPIPDKVLAYAVDTKILKRGNGVNLYSELPVLIDLNDEITQEDFNKKFETLTGANAGSLISVDGTVFVYSTTKKLSSLITTDQSDLALDGKALTTHTHPGVYLTEADIVDIIASAKHRSAEDEDILSYLLLENLSDQYKASQPTPNGYADEFIDLNGIDTDNSIYDYANERLATLKYNWEQLTSSPTTRYGHTSVVINNKMYIFGGYTNVITNDLIMYDPVTDAWTTLTSGATVRYEHSAAVIGTKMYIFGGRNSNDGQKNDLWVYDTTTGLWSQKTSGATARYRASMVAINDKLYMFGGYISGTYYNDLWEYNPTTNAWTQLTSGATVRSQHIATVINGKMYIFGGYGGVSPNYTFKNDTWVYDPGTDTWTQKASGATARYAHSGVTIGTNIYIYGGRSASTTFLADLWEYNSLTNTWLQLESYAPARNTHTAAVMGDIMYIYGGNSGVAASDLWKCELYIAFTIISKNIVNATNDITAVRVLIRGSDYNSMNRDTRIEISRDGGATYAAVTMEKSVLMKGDNTVFVGDCNFDMAFTEDTYESNVLEIEDVKNTITTFTVDVANTSGHFDSAVSSDAAGYRVTFNDESFVDILTITGNGTTANSIKFKGTLAVGSYTVSTISGTYRVTEDYITTIPKTNFFDIEQYASTIVSERYVHASVEVGGKIYMCGGTNLSSVTTNTFLVYDPETDVWTALPNAPVFRYYHSMTNIGNKIYLFGGRTSASYFNDLYVYDIDTYTWTALSSITNGTTNYSHIVAVGTELWVTSLGRIWKYDIDNDTYTEFTADTYTYKNRVYTAAVVVGTRIYVTGGQYNTSYLGTIRYYDTATDTWVACANLSGSRCEHSIALIGTDLYAYGGIASSSIVLNTCCKYDTVNNVSTLVSPSFLSGHGHTAHIIGDIMYVLCGYNTAYNISNSIQTYSITNNVWSMIQVHPANRTYHTMQRVGDKLYILGGTGNDADVYGCVIYDLTTNKWDNVLVDSSNVITGYVKSCIYGTDIILIGGLTTSVIHKFNTLTNTFSEMGNLPGANLVSHQVCIVGDDVYIIGGKYDTAAVTNAVYKGTISGGVISSWSAVAALPQARMIHGAAVVGNEIYVIGGYNTTDSRLLNTTAFCKYNTTTNVWTNITIPTAFYNNIPTIDPYLMAVGTKLYTYGGTVTSTIYNETVIEYDTLTDTWTIVDTGSFQPEHRRYGAYCATETDIYIFGGTTDGDTTLMKTLYRYNLSTNTWVSPNNQYTDITVTQGDGVIVGNKFYIIGGRPIDSNVVYSDINASIDLTTKAVTHHTSMPIARTQHSVVAIGTKIYVIGGYNSTGTLRDVAIYNTETDVWTTGLSCPYAYFRFHKSVAYNNKVYVFSGYNNSSTLQQICACYDPTSNTWSTLTNAPIPFVGGSCGLVGDTVYFFGGITSTGGITDVYAYNITSNSWSIVATDIPLRRYHESAVVDTNIYIYGGDGYNTGAARTDMWRFDTVSMTLHILTPDIAPGSLYSIMDVADNVIYFFGGSVSGVVTEMFFGIGLYPLTQSSIVTCDCSPSYIESITNNTSLTNTLVTLLIGGEYKIYKNSAWVTIAKSVSGVWKYLTDVSSWISAPINSANSAIREALSYVDNQMTYTEVESIDIDVLSVQLIDAIVLFTTESETIGNITLNGRSMVTFDAGKDITYRIRSIEDVSVNGIRLHWTESEAA